LPCLRAAEAPVHRRGSFRAAGCRAPDPRIDAAPLPECAPQLPELDDRWPARHGFRPCASPKALVAILPSKLIGAWLEHAPLPRLRSYIFTARSRLLSITFAYTYNHKQKGDSRLLGISKLSSY